MNKQDILIKAYKSAINDMNAAYRNFQKCFRLQGFPDEYFNKARKTNSDNQLYKQAGNSVTVPVVYEIARRLA